MCVRRTLCDELMFVLTQHIVNFLFLTAILFYVFFFYTVGIHNIGKMANKRKFSFFDQINSNRNKRARIIEEESQSQHHSFDFLKANNIRDIKQRYPGDLNFDSSTLFVPETF